VEQTKLFCKRLFRCFFAILLILCVFAALGGIGAYKYVSSAFAVRLSDTGQTTCYNNTAAITCPGPGDPFYGQDGSYLIDPPSYTKLDAIGDALPASATSWVAVKDNVTGLVWELKTAGNKNTTFTLADAIAYAGGLTLAGRSDWRLPTLKELSSIADFRRSLPAVYTAYFNNTYFSSTLSAFYWSDSDYINNTDYQWGVDFNYGYDDNYLESLRPYYVRAVSDQTAYPTYPLPIYDYTLNSTMVDNNDETVTDTFTGLMWQRDTVQGDIKAWEIAVSNCQGLELAQYSDWRLPSLKELRSIVDYTYFDPAIDPTYFRSTVSSDYWSSTTDIKDFNNACYLNFESGADGWHAKSSSHYVRAVRCGQPRISGNLFILAPARASVWQAGDDMGIEWEPQGISGDVKISISRHGGRIGTFSTIAESIENDGYYDWIVTGPDSVNCILKIEPVNYSSKGTTQGLFIIKPSPNIPTVTTTAVSQKTHISALSGGNVISSGGATVTDRGLCWATFANPTISVCELPSPTHVGSGIGSFTGSITTLTPGTTYHLRAYATNSAGTGYGSDVSFTTYTDTLYVRISGSCEGETRYCYSSIQDAINNAPKGSRILIARGDYTGAESMTLSQPNTTLTLQGGWDVCFTIQTSNTTFVKAPKVPQGTLILQMITIRP